MTRLGPEQSLWLCKLARFSIALFFFSIHLFIFCSVSGLGNYSSPCGRACAIGRLPHRHVVTGGGKKSQPAKPVLLRQAPRPGLQCSASCSCFCHWAFETRYKKQGGQPCLPLRRSSTSIP
jgi:hypothetical protein